MADNRSQQVVQAYKHCQEMVRSHYENFPVASFILPRRLRLPISVIYAFARNADDFADEGDLNRETRLARLQDYDDKLDKIAAGEEVDDPVFIALSDVIKQHALPIQLFHDLITAFRLDVTKTRYSDTNDIWDYCRYSANPVGRLLLHLIGEDSPANLEQSDAICSSLQLINFLQDIEQDYVENNRIYLPQKDMLSFKVTEEHIKEKRSDEAMFNLVQKQINTARDKMLFGKPLGRAMPGRFGFQLRMMINGGLRVLELLEKQRDDLFSRPRLRTRDWVLIAWKAI